MAHNDKALGALVADILGKGVMLETKVAGKVFQIDPNDLPNNAILDLLRYGTQRRFNDATGGSDKTEADKHAKAAEMIEAYKEGQTAMRRAGGGVDELHSIMRQLAGKVLKQHLPKEEYKERFTDAETQDRNAMLDKLIEKNREVFEEPAKEELAKRQAERAKLGGLAKAVTFEL